MTNSHEAGRTGHAPGAPRRGSLHLFALVLLSLSLALFSAAPAAALDISGSVSGGQSGAGSLSGAADISGGTVSLLGGGSVTGMVIGGAADTGNVSGSSVRVAGGTSTLPTYGAYVQTSGNVT
jgi:hypothetical protein